MKLSNEIKLLLEAKMDLRQLVAELQVDVEQDLIKSIENNLIERAKYQVELIKDKNITYPVSWNYKNPHDQIDLIELIDTGSEFNKNNIYDTSKVKLASDYKERASKMAIRGAKEILESFSLKVYSKLSVVIEKVGSPSKSKLDSRIASRGELEADMYMEWPSGAGFTFTTQIVYGMTESGKWFARYPGTFHNVINGDGSKIKKASEAKMKELFTV